MYVSTSQFFFHLHGYYCSRFHSQLHVVMNLYSNSKLTRTESFLHYSYVLYSTAAQTYIGSVLWTNTVRHKHLWLLSQNFSMGDVSCFSCTFHTGLSRLPAIMLSGACHQQPICAARVSSQNSVGRGKIESCVRFNETVTHHAYPSCSWYLIGMS